MQVDVEGGTALRRHLRRQRAQQRAEIEAVARHREIEPRRPVICIETQRAPDLAAPDLGSERGHLQRAALEIGGGVQMDDRHAAEQKRVDMRLDGAVEMPERIDIQGLVAEDPPLASARAIPLPSRPGPAQRHEVEPMRVERPVDPWPGAVRRDGELALEIAVAQHERRAR